MYIIILYSLATVISFMITTYHGLIECTPISEPFAASCQPYKVECDIIPKSNFDFNCSAKLPAFSGMECAELHPPPDICKQLTVVSTTPGITAVAKGGLADVTVRAGAHSTIWVAILLYSS